MRASDYLGLPGGPPRDNDRRLIKENEIHDRHLLVQSKTKSTTVSNKSQSGKDNRKSEVKEAQSIPNNCRHHLQELSSRSPQSPAPSFNPESSNMQKSCNDAPVLRCTRWVKLGVEGLLIGRHEQSKQFGVASASRIHIAHQSTLDVVDFSFKFQVKRSFVTIVEPWQAA